MRGSLPHERPPPSARWVRSPASALGDRRLGRDRDRAGPDRQLRGPPGERQRRPPGNRLAGRHQPARQQAASAGQWEQPDRPPVEHLPRGGQERADRQRGRLVALEEPVRDPGPQPALAAGGERHHQGRQDRLRIGRPEALFGRHHRRPGEQRPGRGQEAHRRDRDPRVGGRLPRPAALQPEHAGQRDHRGDRRPRDHADRVPPVGGDAAANHHGDRRSRERARHRRPRRPPLRRALDRPDPRHDARPGGGNRLRAVHHQPPPASAG